MDIDQDKIYTEIDYSNGEDFGCVVQYSIKTNSIHILSVKYF